MYWLFHTAFWRRSDLDLALLSLVGLLNFRFRSVVLVFLLQYVHIECHLRFGLLSLMGLLNFPFQNVVLVFLLVYVHIECHFHRNNFFFLSFVILLS